MKRIIAVLLSLAVLLVSFGIASALAKSDSVTISKEEYEAYQKTALLAEIMDIVDELYYGKYDEETLINAAAESMLDALGDDYTFFYTQEMLQNMSIQNETDYDCVGLQLVNYDGSDRCYIAQVRDGSPAREAGLCRGDILLRIEPNFEVNADNISDAAARMSRSYSGELTLTVLRNGEVMSFCLNRRKTEINYVESRLLEDGIGYIHLFEFAGTCVDEVATELAALVDMGAKGIILDLRDNPGGWLEEAQQIGDLFMDEGEVCYLQYKDGRKEHCYPTKDGKVDVQVVVLINEVTASAAEVLAGALRDSLDAPVVGVTSFGKGIVQFEVELSGGNLMQITGAEYVLPGGEKVHHVGLTPDFECMLATDENGDYVFGDFDDVQLDIAVEVMRGRLR